MSDRDDTEAEHTLAWEQTGLRWPDGYRPSSAPPPTRAECEALPRPCPRTTCVHNLQREDEPSGRPGDNVHRDPMPIRLVRRQESCSLDVAHAHLDGLTRRQVGEMLDVGAPRVRQIEIRGAAKGGAAKDLCAYLDALAELFRAQGRELTYEPLRPPELVTHTILVAVTVGDCSRAPAVIRRKPKR